MHLPRYRTALVSFLIATALALGGFALLSAGAGSLDAVGAAPSADCGVVSCTTYLPLVIKNYPPPASLEVTQGVQQPDNSVVLIKDRPTFVRYTLTSTIAYAGVNAYLHGTRNDVPLPGSPIAALNNPRTLEATADRAVLNDTFNFQLPSSWLNGTISLHVVAGNGTFSTTGGAKAYSFVYADVLKVAVVPIAYTCTSGGSGTVTPAGPYDYLVDYTYKTYPVPGVALSTKPAEPYAGPCTSGQPNPTIGDWSEILDRVTTRWSNDNASDTYYFGLIKIYCPSSCIAGIGWVGYVKAAVGFDGFGASHSGASETHAHEVGHNHGREHAPGCGAAYSDPTFPYVPADGKARIGDAANPNYGFNIGTQAIYAYSARYDFMSYCTPTWISDYTYEALRQWNSSHRIVEQAVTPDPHALLVSGSIDPGSGRVAFRPVFTLDAPTRIPEPGDYMLELLDATGRTLAAYPFAPARAHSDHARDAGPGAEYLGFNMTLPHADGLAEIRIRHGDTILGALRAGANAPVLQAGISALSADGESLRVNWSGSDADRDRLSYLVRASTDGGATWQTIGARLAAPSIDLRPADFGGESVLIEVLASDGLRTTASRWGPFAVPQLTKDQWQMTNDQ